LSLLRHNDDSALAHSYSLNLNVSTLLSPEFLAFDANLRTGARGSIIIEIEKIDIFADLGAYIFARDFVRERGYRLCLDGVTALTLPFIDRERLGVDLIKLFWSPDMIDNPDGERSRELLAALERTGKTRVILARCDGPAAIDFGQSVGIRLFQGRHLDRITSVALSPLHQKLAPTTR
jgi:EAL domain-containing protein (putative c-di-GMP-specific phosphodiesterase class I)